mmetsp:Transcript_26788/g.40859  ORF Transcript_26788/g.40859 Transcript_26788/m.40859 type:complete len:273 (+) Transcript_26788:1468-2286(+)
MRRDHSTGLLGFLLLLLHFPNEAEHFLQLLGLLLHVDGQNGKQVLVVLVAHFELGLESITDYVNLGRVVDGLSLDLTGHELDVLVANLLLLLTGTHEGQLATRLFVDQRINEQVQVVHLGHFIHELLDVGQELRRVYIVDHVDVHFMLAKQAEGLAVSFSFNIFHGLLDADQPGEDTLEVTSWHLENSPGAGVYAHDLRAALNRSDVEVALGIQARVHWQFTVSSRQGRRGRRLGQLSVQIIVEQFMGEPLSRISEAEERLADMEGCAVVGE